MNRWLRIAMGATALLMLLAAAAGCRDDVKEGPEEGGGTCVVNVGGEELSGTSIGDDSATICVFTGPLVNETGFRCPEAMPNRRDYGGETAICSDDPSVSQWTDEEVAAALPPLEPVCVDEDGDGSCADVDCDDTDASVRPGRSDVIDDKDNDCDNVVDEDGGCVDEDGDGFCVNLDCDDTEPTVFPGAAEAADGLDNNCDGAVDNDFCVDADSDGYCSQIDCNDEDPLTYPGAAELMDGRDNDCDDVVDNGCVPSCDGRECGPDQCGGLCGTCDGALSCDATAGLCGP